jgi:phosphatidylinositol alpha-1,6-mannosyltransferase
LKTVLTGTDVAQTVPRKAALERPPPGPPLVLSVGGVKPRKGFHVSLRAFGLLQRRIPAARYVIAGRNPEGKYLSQLREMIRGQGIRNVEFSGVVDDAGLDRLYREATLFIQLSQEERLRFEGLGLVYFEAGAYGLPVVAGRSGGIPDAVIDGETGFLVDPADAEAAAQAMERLIKDGNLSARMGRAGRALAERLTWARFAREQWREYQSVPGSGFQA